MQAKEQFMPKEYAEKIEITPEMAQRMLGDDHRNYRSLSLNRVLLYTEDMKNDRWDDNGQPIIIDQNGRVIDGQHRLHACIRAGRPFTTWVIYGVPAAKIETIDTGKPRTMRDILDSRRSDKADVLAAALPFIYNWEKTKCLLRDSSSHPTRKSLLGVLNRHPRLIQYCSKPKALRELGLQHSFTSALRYVLVLSSSEEVANQFLGELSIGEMLSVRNPVFQLRRRLQRDVATNASKLQKRTKVALVCKAWNLWIAGQECTTLKWTSTGPNSEPFPTVITQEEAIQEND